MLYALTVLLVFQLLGELLVQWLKLPLPGPLIGMLLLFAMLMVRGAVPHSLRETAGTILQNLTLLFIPAVAGVMVDFERIGQDWVPFLIAGIGGTAITMAVTALTLRLMLARGKAGTE